MTTVSPLVSVLMTAFNREDYIAQAIESVLASSYTNFELIIVDDNSSDKTVRIVETYLSKDNRIKLFINEVNIGDYPNRNRAASFSKGKYLKYLDSDDLIYSYGLEAFVYFMEQHEDVALGICSLINQTVKPFPHIFKPNESLRHHFFIKGFLDCAPTGTIIRSSAFFNIGGFSGKRMLGDIEFGVKCASRHTVMLLPPGLIFWRNHGRQEVHYGISHNLYSNLYLEIFKPIFDEIGDEILTKGEKERIAIKEKRSGLDSIFTLLKHFKWKL